MNPYSSSTKRELLLGAGSSKHRWLGNGSMWSNLTTLDFNSAHAPDVVHDLRQLPYPFHDSSFDELHAYHVLEHLGQQGDFLTFFAQFSEFYRVLKPDGVLYAICPAWNSKWAWGDPGHTRVISRETLIFLSQFEYTQVGKTPLTDYRFCYQADFDVLCDETVGDTYTFALRAVKPSRAQQLGDIT